MPETRDLRERSPWARAGDDWQRPFTNPWALEAIAQRGYDDYGLAQSGVLPGELEQAPDFFNASAEDEYRSRPGSVRSQRSAERVAGVLRDAMGEDFDPDSIDLTDLAAVGDVIANDLADPQAAFAALDHALADLRRDVRAVPGESSRSYVVAEQAWREDKGLPRRRRSLPPSRTPERRRAQYIANKARRLGVSREEAERATRRHTSQLRFEHAAERPNRAT